MCTLSSSLLRKVLAEEREDLAPAIHGLFRPVQRPVPVKEAMAGAIVAMEFVILGQLLEFGFVLIDLLRARRAIIVAEQSKQRTVEILGHVDWRDRRLVVELFLAHDNAPAPQFHAGVDVFFLARINKGVPPAGAGPENADLAIQVR